MDAHSVSNKHINNGAKRRYRLLMVFLLCVFIWFCVIAFGQNGKLRERAKLLESIELQQQDTQKQNDDLKKEADRVSDPEYRLELARKQLNMIKPGETGFDVPKKH